MNLKEKIKEIEQKLYKEISMDKEFITIERFPSMDDSVLYIRINEKDIFVYTIDLYGIFKVNISEMQIDYYSEGSTKTEEEIKKIIVHLKEMAKTIKLKELF
jgi:hypothetical protein